MKFGMDQSEIPFIGPGFLRGVLLAASTIYFSYFSPSVAIGGEIYFYSEGVCYKSNGRAASNHEACGFMLSKADRYEWDMIENQCKKIDVYVSKLNPEWELRKPRKKEKYSLRDCGYSVSKDQEESSYNLASGSCKKNILLVSHYGLEDRIQPNRSPANIRGCQQNKELIGNKRSHVQNSSAQKTSLSASAKLTGQTSAGVKSRRK
ncbi:MAG: hypothetical protein IPL83_03170 [Bdellovibrionales bacterium]|nr:hypothetical protein [Bdellovibrionales bacterium]